MPDIIGWDIGGVHLKAARLRFAEGRCIETRARVRYFELWRQQPRLEEALRNLRRELGGEAAAHALTMTAELADCFTTKVEGVRTVVSAAARALEGEALLVWGVDGKLASPAEAAERPLVHAASNWLATAEVSSRGVPNGILIDVGSTTADLVPLAGGRPAPGAFDDTGRLAAGELVYTGVLRTPPAALACEVPVGGAWCRLSPEPFAFTSDVYLALGRIEPSQATAPTSDGRPTTPEAALARLARLVCADLQALGRRPVLEMARFLESAQIGVLERAARQVMSRLAGGAWGTDAPPIVVSTGLGGFLAERLAHRLGLSCRSLSDLIPLQEPQAAPATCVALLLAEQQGCLSGMPS
jgi:hypothetical protein